MKTKIRKIKKRILSCVLTLAMVVSLFQMMGFTSHAADPITLSGNTYTTDPGEGFEFRAYFWCKECGEYIDQDTVNSTHSFKIHDFNYTIKNGVISGYISATGKGCLGEGSLAYSYTRNYDCTKSLYVPNGYEVTSGDTDLGNISVYTIREKTAHKGGATCKTAVNCTLCGTSYIDASNHEQPNEFTYSINTLDDTKHDKRYTCCGALMVTETHTVNPIYTINATDSTKHDKTYSCCNGIVETTVHDYVYTANDETDTITETCLNDCGHSATVQLVIDETVSRKYTGSKIYALKVIKSDNWTAQTTITYGGDLINVGNSASGEISVDNISPQVSVKKNYAIEKGDMNITATGHEGKYDETAHSITVNVPEGATVQYRTNETADWSDTNPTFTSVGTYKVYYKVTKENYNEVTGSATVVINPANMTVTATDYFGTYDGNPHSITVNAPESATIEYRLSENESWSTTKPAITNPTDTPVTIYYRVTQENYNDVTDSATVTIDKIEPTADMFTFIAPENLVYDGNAKAATVVKTDGEAVGDITLRYYDSNNTMYTEAPKDVGTYTVKILVGGNDLYYETQEPIYPTDGTNWTFIILPKEIHFTWSETENLKYTGESLVPKATVAEEELVEGDTCIIYTKFVGADQGNEGAGIVPGTWKVQISHLSNTNYGLIHDDVDSPSFLEFTIINGDQEKPVLSYASETIDGRNDGEIGSLTTAMEYKKASDSNYTPITSESLTNLSDGTYYVRYAAKQYYDASPDTEVIISAGNKLKVNIPETQNGYTLTVNETEVSWEESATLTFALKEGYSKTEGFALKVNTETVALDADGKYTIFDIQTNQIIKVEGVADITPPRAEIQVKENNWNTFFNGLTFGIFFKETQEVTITANDVNTGSGLDKVYYYLSSEELTEDSVKAIADADWVEYTEVFNINPDKEYIIYAKATDKADNTVYINSNGLVLDATTPKITGIENNGTYYGNTEFGVKESYLDTVTVDGETITLTDGKYTITADDKEHTIIATDKATNSNTKMKIKVVAIASLDDAIEELTTSNVKSSDKEAIKEILELVESLLDSGKDFTDAEDAKLIKIKSNAETLLDQIKKAKDAVDNETTDKVGKINSDNVNVSDKNNLENAKTNLEQALKNYPDNYTESEKETIEADIQRLEDAIKSIKKVKDATSKVTNLPTKVEPDDLETVDKIKDAKNTYDLLTDHEKSLISAEDKEKLESLLAQSVDYKIVEGNDSSIRENSDGTLRFKANGSFSKFIGLEVDDNLIDAKYYTAESGSTIITLKNKFLDKLSVGTHSIKVNYTDGEATGKFKIKAKQVSVDENEEDEKTTELTNPSNAKNEQVKEVPKMGDEFNVMLYATLIFVTGISLIVMNYLQRRNIK